MHAVLFLLYIVSTYANTMATMNQACLSAYGTCRKYQDDASPAISACDQNPAGLASKLKSLTDNANAVNAARAANAARARRGLLLNMRQQTASQCSDVVDLTNSMVEALKDNPASTLVGQIAEQIVNATSVVCTPDDIASLNKLDADINDTETSIVDELANVQDSLLGKMTVHTRTHCLKSNVFQLSVSKSVHD